MKRGKSMGQSLEILNYKKSNDLISAKYKASGLENQLIAIALTRLEEQYDAKGLVCFEAEIYPGEIRQLIKNDDHIYRDLKRAAHNMSGRTICLEDGKGNFKVFSLIPNAKYENRVFTIAFNKELQPHIYELNQKYTTLQLSMVTELKDWSFRIYEVLKKDLGYYSSKSHQEECEVEYRISEFRFMIGLANIENETVKKQLTSNPDWDALYDLLPKSDKKYTKPFDFRKNVLEPAQKELKEKSDIAFDFELLNEGKYQRKIKFKIWSQNLNTTDEILKKQRILKKGLKQLSIPNDLPQYKFFYDKYEGDEDFNFGNEDLSLFLERAGYNTTIVMDAIEAARKQPNLNNFMGWIISYIEKGGYADRPSIYGDAEKGQKFKEFATDYDEGKRNGTVQKSAWELLLKRENFSKFEEFLVEKCGWDAQMLVDLYGYEKAVKIYMDWNRGKEVSFE